MQLCVAADRFIITNSFIVVISGLADGLASKLSSTLAV